MDKARKELVDQHLAVVEKHTDNWTNGTFASHTPEGALKLADLIISMAHTEVRAARVELDKLSC